MPTLGSMATSFSTGANAAEAEPRATHRQHHASVTVAVVAALVGAVLPVDGLDSSTSVGFDTAEARRSEMELIQAPVNRLRPGTRRAVAQRSTRSTVLLEIEDSGDARYLIFRPDRIALASTGTTIIKRSLEDGSFVQMKVFIRDDADSFIRIVPDGRRSSMELLLYGTELYRNIPVNRAFEQLLGASVIEIARAAPMVDWDLVFYRRHATESDLAVARLVATIEQDLPNLSDADDGAMDAYGQFVYIDDGVSQQGPGGFNCSGFAKWVVDGLYYPLAGRFIDIDALKVRHETFRGTRWSDWYETRRDPFFGLDWARNLALELHAAQGVALPTPEASDVRSVPHFTYREDIGYPIDYLDTLLFFLAAEQPGAFYIASLNREFGSAPILRQHSHLALLFPWFDSAGRFQVAVIERNVETSTASLANRYRGAYAHLTRIEVADRFSHR